MITPFLFLLFSLLGFLFGLALSFLAPEELRPGKKYFVLVKNSLFYLITLFSLSVFVYFKKYHFIFIILVYFLVFFIFIKKNLAKKIFFLGEILNYSFFVSTFIIFLFTPLENTPLLIFFSLLFLYGLPAGTLSRFYLMEKQELKYSPEAKLKHA